MTLIKSISGIRGTIGGRAGTALTPLDTVKFTAAYATWLKKQCRKQTLKVVLGRDARLSGNMVKQLVAGTLMGCGADVIDIDLASTPTTELAVAGLQADGGIILTASHNPRQWNALKLLNNKGEFLSGEDGRALLQLADDEDFDFSDIDNIGCLINQPDYTDQHIEAILNLPLVDCEAISKAGFKIAVDAVNSVGGMAIPCLLRALGVKDIVEMYCEPSGEFPHNPEPLPDNLTAIAEAVVSEKADLAFVVDPDVDRLAIVTEDGSMFGEEYTLVAVADYVLAHKTGNTVSNLSSSRALRDITRRHGGQYRASAVGEVNVVDVMKATQAVIGGEGNGGVIYPDLHYGRDALVGVALFLSHLAKSGKTCSQLRAQYPDYHISKNKIQLTQGIDVDAILEKVQQLYADQELNTTDGLKIDWADRWVHLRKSNTEPIIRIYAEAPNKAEADELAQAVMDKIEELTTS